jgi:hypothetical protein
LLRLALARQRPQPGAGAATDNDWRDQARRHWTSVDAMACKPVSGCFVT